MAKVLIVGGAGYVGSATSAYLIDHGHEVWILDSLITGHRNLVLGSGFILGKAGDRQKIRALLADQNFDCVMHFAARSLVEESVRFPNEYYENNVLQTSALLEELLSQTADPQKKPPVFIFSSTCAIFGDPGNQEINEALPKNPINPYGKTKLQVEVLMEKLAREKGLQGIALRYFNAAGAETQLRVGEWHDQETHLIPRIIQAGERSHPIEIYGTDYPTADGTCIRDYIHVSDLAAAHVSGMNRLLTYRSQTSQGNPSAGVFEAYNLGSETGYSVDQVIRTTEEVLGRKLLIERKARRPGDPPRLVANSSLARSRLNFPSVPTNLRTILSTAWEWERKKSQILRKAVFLDRDGTLNFDPGYLNDPEKLELLPNVGPALAMLKEAGYLLIVISNQSGVARGFIREEVLTEIHRKLNELLDPWCARIHRFELCLHHPDEDCPCRKPKPQLIFKAANAMGIDLSKSFMIGDKISDIEAGIASGCQASLLVKTGSKDESLHEKATHSAAFIGRDLLECAKWVVKR